MSSIQRKAGTTFDFIQDYANQPIIMNSSEPVSSLPDPTMLEISGALLAPDGTGLMQTQNSQDELSSVLSQLGLPESYVTNQLNSNSAGLSYLQSLNPEILGVIQNPSDEAIRAEFVDAHYDGEMKETDKLNPAKLSAQCNSYTEKLNQENLSLDALYTAFYNASAVDLEGKTAGAFLEQCENYCIIIECLQIANYCDIKDNTKLYNKLGYIYLDGEVIIPGRIEAIENWNTCIDKRNTCNYLAGLTDDDDDRDRLHSEAGYWQGMADSYYAEWERLTKLKEEFEEVNANTKGLYKGNAPQLRSCAYQGMQLVGYAFEAGEYTMQGNVDEWKKNALQLKNTGLFEIAEKWKTDDGDWDMEALEAEISIEDPSVISNVEYLALCNAFESMDIEDKEKFISMSFCVIDEEYQSVTDTKLNISPVYQRMTEVYSESLTINVDSNGEISSADQNKLFSYNLLYTYSHIQPTYIINTMDMEGGKEGIDIRANVNIEQNGNDYTVQLYRDDVDFESPEYTLYGYSKNLDTTIDNEEDLYTAKQRKDPWGEIRNEGGDILIGAVVGEAIDHVDDIVLDKVPIVNTLYDCYNDYDSLKKAYDEAIKNNEAWSNITTMDDIEDAAMAYHMGGSVIAADGVVCVTAYTYPSDDIDDKINEYNMSHPNNKLNYNADEFLNRMVTEPSYADQFMHDYPDLYYKLKGVGVVGKGETVHF